MKKTYLDYIWHDPNCMAWHRDLETNKVHPHLIGRGIEYKCTCGYDEDYERLQKFIKGELK